MIGEAYSGTHNVSTTEWSLTTDTAGPDVQTADGIYVGVLDLSNLAGGDTFRFQVMEKARAADTQRVLFSVDFTGVQSPANWRSEPFLLMHGWDMTLKRTAGADRVINWSVRKIS